MKFIYCIIPKNPVVVKYTLVYLVVKYTLEVWRSETLIPAQLAKPNECLLVY